jgi:hypothetical protein
VLHKFPFQNTAGAIDYEIDWSWQAVVVEVGAQIRHGKNKMKPQPIARIF